METGGRGPILELLIQTDPEKTAELEGEGCRVRMIPFSGRATGPLFQGLIAPGAVDTQITNAAEVRHMSARYMLIGQDADGQDCHIYVENNAWFVCFAPYDNPEIAVACFIPNGYSGSEASQAPRDFIEWYMGQKTLRSVDEALPVGNSLAP